MLFVNKMGRNNFVFTMSSCYLYLMDHATDLGNTNKIFIDEVFVVPIL